MKYIIVTGGVVSGLGKGITASSIGLLLKSHGYNITAIKIDPYVNLDAGTMSPFEHGEVYVLDDGGETDLDLGNYERFLGLSLKSENNLTTGKVYQAVIEAERRGDYLGKTVQVVPHITDYIQQHIRKTAKLPVDSTGCEPDICIIELGGTIGDIESLPFIEALAQFKQDLPPSDYCFVHVSLLPTLASGELKTKPTQHSVKSAKSYGLVPDILCLRSDKDVPMELREKIKRTCHLPRETEIITNHNVDSIYRVPNLFKKQHLDRIILKKMALTAKIDDESVTCNPIANYITFLDSNLPAVKIGIVGKYTGMQDTYLSLIRALEHASCSLLHKLEIEWIDSELFEKEPDKVKCLSVLNGVLIPGGFGKRGIEGMVLAAKYCRENDIPLFGVCLGMQVMLIDIARHKMDWKNANSSEFDPDTPYPIIHKSLKLENLLGGTMRLGLYDINLKCMSLMLFQKSNNTETTVTQERHRHRYEVNNKLYQKILERNFVKSGGESDSETDNPVIEIIETEGHKLFSIGAQFHPEYLSRNENPHWLFKGFIKASIDNK